MKILSLMAQHHWTGPVEPELLKLKELARRGHKITFCFSHKPEGTLASCIDDYGLEVLDDVTLYRKRPSPLSFMKDVRLLRQHCRDRNIDIVHSHLSHDHFTALAMIRRLNRRPVLLRSVHESRKLESKAGERLLYSRADGFLVPASHFARKLEQNFGIDPERIAVVHGMVDANRFKPGLPTDALFEEIGANKETKLIGIVSRIKPGRGHKELIEAFRKIAPEFPDTRLLIVGKGEGVAAEVQRAADLVKAGRVHFLGYRKDDLPNILRALSVKVLLGEGSDTTCRATLEAMACATPVIAAPVGALPDTIDEKGGGLLIDVNVPDALEQALRRALTEPGFSQEMGDRARTRILERHTIEKAADRVEAFYKKMCGVRA